MDNLGTPDSNASYYVTLNILTAIGLVLLAAFTPLRSLLAFFVWPMTLFVLLPTLIGGTFGIWARGKSVWPFVSLILTACAASELVMFFELGTR